MNRFTEFVMGHEGDEVEALVLQKGRWPDIDVALAADTIAGRRKMRVKVPSWWECAELVYPSRLCVEQCSSETAGKIKADIIGEIIGEARHRVRGNSGDDSVGEPVNNDKKIGAGEGCDLKFKGLRVADLTGGLGVDSWMFSKMAERILYVEQDYKLTEAAKHNFSALGRKNIEIINAEVCSEGFLRVGDETGGTEVGPDVITEVGGKTGRSANADGFVNSEGKSVHEADGWAALKKFAPDIIYLDPARRGEGGEKVFKLEDCRPNILELRDKLLELAPHVMVKLSPMADINEVVRQLGQNCLREDVISVDGECKEVLVTLERGYQWEGLIGVNCGKSGSFAFLRSDEATAVPHYLSNGAISGLVGKILLEPDKALMKAAPFKLLSERFGLVKLDVSTHYYIDCGSDVSEISDRETNEDDGWDDIDRDEKISGLFRRFRILRVEPMNKKTIRTLGQDYPNAEVTARNIPLATDELRKRLAIGSSKLRKSPSPNSPQNLSSDPSEPHKNSPHSNTEPLGRPSDTIHIFALRAASQNLLFVTEKL